MKKKQFLALALSAVMAGGMLAGCGSSNGSTSSSKSDAKDEVVTLKWIQVGNGMPKDYDEWLEQINPYLEEKIGVNVDMEIVPWGDWDNRRSVITNSGEYFDILFTDQNRYSSEVNTGALMDITDLLKDNASELYNMIPEDYWKAVPAMAGGKHILGKAKRHIFGTAKVGEKGQIVIPKDARQIFGVKPGDTLLILGDEETGIIVTKPDVLRDAADDIFGKMEK